MERTGLKLGDGGYGIWKGVEWGGVWGYPGSVCISGKFSRIVGDTRGVQHDINDKSKF